MTGRLAGKRCIVTGAAGGIGSATVAAFLAEGATVLSVDRRTPELPPGAARHRDRFTGLSADVTDGEAARRAVTAFGDVEVLATFAAVSVGGAALHETSEETWRHVLDVNLMGTVRWVGAVLPAMRRARRGSIVTVASQLALAGGRGNVSYVTAKGAVIALTRALALDYADEGIRANCLLPGAVETPMLERAFARAADPRTARERSLARHPLGRFGRPEEVALAAVFLASDDSSFTTGAVLPVEGGWLAG